MEENIKTPISPITIVEKGDDSKKFHLYARIPEILYLKKPTKVVAQEGHGAYFSSRSYHIADCADSVRLSKIKAIKGIECQIRYENKPVEGLTIAGSRYDKSGNLLFCVHIPGVATVQVSPEFISHVIMKGLLEGNRLKGEYSFVKFDESISLVSVESELYKKAMEFEEKSKKPKLNLKKFEYEVGCCYQTSTTKTSLFLGYMSTIELKVIQDSGDKITLSKFLNTYYDIDHRNYLNSNLRTDIVGVKYPYDEIKFHCTEKKVPQIGLWYNIGTANSYIVSELLGDPNPDKMLKQRLENSSSVAWVRPGYFHDFSLDKGYNHIERCDFIPKIEIDDNFVMRLKELFKGSVTKELEKKPSLKIYSFFHALLMSKYAPFINMNYIGFANTRSSYFDYLEEHIQDK